MSRGEILRNLDHLVERASASWAVAEASSRRSRETLRSSRWRVRASRLRLDHPRIRHIRGGSDPPDAETIRARLRQALLDGTLPRIDGNRSWAGHGTGRACRVCGRPIDTTQVEHEIQEPEPALVHHLCLLLWREESHRR
jgi:hypothetical protein